ncbi:MAG TPA: hypothetical protein VGU71_10755 [Candidatus Dormibacteraeota bacterium]|nr:hypothetical protein [Candidatus Dormibacteraeota bacterium]
MALSVVLIILFAGAFMYLVTTFLFNFSGGQSRMGPVVTYGGLAVIAGTTLLAAIVWKIRSPSAALVFTAIATPVTWAVAVFVEWIFSFVFGAG